MKKINQGIEGKDFKKKIEKNKKNIYIKIESLITIRIGNWGT